MVIESYSNGDGVGVGVRLDLEADHNVVSSEFLSGVEALVILGTLNFKILNS